MMMPYIFWGMLFFSLHACSARPLGFRTGDRVSDLKPFPISRKEIRVSKLDDQSTTHRHRDWAQMDEANSHNHETQILKFEDTDGSNVEEAYYPAQKDTYEEERGLKREVEGRSTLQSLGRHGRGDVEEKVDSKEHEIPEDVVVMDYAQPQRKPPIHNNKKP